MNGLSKAPFPATELITHTLQCRGGSCVRPPVRQYGHSSQPEFLFNALYCCAAGVVERHGAAFADGRRRRPCADTIFTEQVTVDRHNAR